MWRWHEFGVVNGSILTASSWKVQSAGEPDRRERNNHHLKVVESGEPRTYSRGFFFGPGFPRGLGKISPIWFRLLLLPGLGPGIPFLRGVGAAGVEAASEALSTEEGGAKGSADVEEGDALSLLGFFLLLDEATLLGKRLRRSGASLRTTALFDRSDLVVDRPFDEEVGVVVVAAGMVVTGLP
jgi:hypothetical protein